MNEPSAQTGRQRLFPDNVAPVQLHRRPTPLLAAIDRCAAAGWTIIELDIGGWADRERLHDDLTAALSLAGHYGRNLDAFVDEIQSLPQARDPRFADATGLAFVLRQVDQLVASDPLLAQDVIEIFVDGALHALHYGWPVAVLLQSDDPAIQLAPAATTAIGWNRAERNPADRA